ncbi:MAG: hypothetical protein JWM28_1818, partial [Chitinophagaceae bacterium]|nr:hypothetical protein [Chitinophagaceae bacterium]
MRKSLLFILAILTLYAAKAREKDGGLYPLKLRVTCNREQRYYPFPSKYDMNENDFTTLMGENPEKFQKTRDVFDSEKLAANGIIVCDLNDIHSDFKLF